jgi:hypothetical protein
VGDRRESGLILVLTSVAAVASTGLAVAINAATDVGDRWPGGLELIRAHPFRWSAGLTAVVVAVGAALWLGQRSADRRSAELLPATSCAWFSYGTDVAVGGAAGLYLFAFHPDCPKPAESDA